MLNRTRSRTDSEAECLIFLALAPWQALKSMHGPSAVKHGETKSVRGPRIVKHDGTKTARGRVGLSVAVARAASVRTSKGALPRHPAQAPCFLSVLSTGPEPLSKPCEPEQRMSVSGTLSLTHPVNVTPTDNASTPERRTSQPFLCPRPSPISSLARTTASATGRADAPTCGGASGNLPRRPRRVPLAQMLYLMSMASPKLRKRYLSSIACWYADMIWSRVASAETSIMSVERGTWKLVMSASTTW